MIKITVGKKTYGIDMDSRCFHVGTVIQVKDKDGVTKDELSGTTYHTTVKSVRNRLLWMAGSDKFPEFSTLSELKDLFDEYASAIDAQLEGIKHGTA